MYTRVFGYIDVNGAISAPGQANSDALAQEVELGGGGHAQMAPSLFLSPRNLGFLNPTISKGRQAVSEVWWPCVV